jgi:cytosine/adenosine deaminase-related metal-dependent hydrolase
MTAREALRLGTRGGAAVLTRDDLGSLEPGKCADFAVWDVDVPAFSGADDPVAALVLGGPQRVSRLVVGGEEVSFDEEEILREHRKQATRFV